MDVERKRHLLARLERVLKGNRHPYIEQLLNELRTEVDSAADDPQQVPGPDTRRQRIPGPDNRRLP